MGFDKLIFFVEDISENTVITDKHIRRIRPGYGLAPKFIDDVLGKKVKRDITRGTPVSWEVLT